MEQGIRVRSVGVPVRSVNWVRLFPVRGRDGERPTCGGAFLDGVYYFGSGVRLCAAELGLP